MSLEGSLQTIALPEVLQLLSETSKSGELLVSGDRGDGRLWFDAGRLSGFDVRQCAEPADALFELLRAESGRFSFEAGTTRPDSAHPVGDEAGEDVLPILEVAQAQLEEWSGIVAVVPSLDHRAALSPEAPSEKVELSAAQWSLIVVIGEGRSVGEVLDRAGLSEFDGCRSLKTLVEADLVSLSEAEELTAVEPEPLADAEPAQFGLEEAEAETDAPEGVAADPVADFEAPASDSPGDARDEPAAGVVVSGGEFDGHDFVFKAPPPSSEAGYEPQPVPFPDHYSNGHGVFDVEAVEGSEEGSMASRAALEALLAEIPGEDGGDDPERLVAVGGEVHDGLADRGPWTSQELASFDFADNERDAEAPDLHFEHADAQERAEDEESPADGALEPADEPEEEAPQPEPVNRGLLLKFLSSVRS